MKNPLSRTRLKFTKSGARHFSLDARVCRDCGHEYHPQIHTDSSYLKDAIGIGAGVGIYFLIKIFLPEARFLIPILGVCLLLYVYWRAQNPRLKTANARLRAGDTIIECPKCGGDSPEPAEQSESADA